MAEDGDDDKEDVYKNWRPQKQDTDFAAHAGQAEKEVQEKLGFNLLNSKEIRGSHGLEAKGFLTPDALRVIGIGNYTRLCRRSGKVVEEAQDAATSIRKPCGRRARRTFSMSTVWTARTGIAAIGPSGCKHAAGGACVRVRQPLVPAGHALRNNAGAAGSAFVPGSVC
jgi:hypothetical protein